MTAGKPTAAGRRRAVDMVFFDAQSLFNFLREQYEKKECPVDIATYGISLFEEKTPYGSFESSAMKFMNCLRGGATDVRVLVGLQPIKKFRNSTYGMRELEYRKMVRRVLEIGEEYGICCLPTQKSHLKMYRIGDLYVVGGINLGNSYWTDCSVVVENQDDKDEMQYVFDAMWHGACTVQPLCEISEMVQATDCYEETYYGFDEVET